MPGALRLASESSPEELSESKPAQDKGTVISVAREMEAGLQTPRRAALHRLQGTGALAAGG